MNNISRSALTPEQSKGRAAYGHVVQFYENDRFLCEAAANFLADGLTAGNPAVAIATAEHLHTLQDLLHDKGFNIQCLIDAGQLIVLDARETLVKFMNGRMPDADRFASYIGSQIEKIRAGRDQTVVSAFGEMVDVLWQAGNGGAAIRLEELWNDLAQKHRFSLLCGYALRNFVRAADGDGFQQVCDQHGQVLPAEQYDASGDENARLRQISLLQQRALALEAEIERRTELEALLRSALAAREQAEAEREHLLSCERAARASAEAANRHKDHFLAILSHELRTPLTAILGWAHLLCSNRDERIIERAIDVIQRNAKLQLRMIDDLLDASRGITGRMTIASTPVDLFSLLNTAVENVRTAATAKSIVMDLQLDQAARFVHCDPDRMQQVVWNLLTNAIKFTPHGGRVELGLKGADTHVEIVVRDTGQGIASEFLPFVFDRFSQAQTGCTRKYGGLGVGLSVVRDIMQAHGGTVAAASAGEGCGATFIIRLPRSRS
jgi:signal transduction histidine kinase